MGGKTNFQANPNSLMKKGTKEISGSANQQAMESCSDLGEITTTSFGPYSLNKLVKNHLGKLMITHDAGAIMEQLEVQHPAAKLLAMAAKSQDTEIGDATNLVVLIASSLITKAQPLIFKGLHTSDIRVGFEIASEVALKFLTENMVVSELKDVRDAEAVQNALRPVLYSKQPNAADHLSALASQAVITACPEDPKTFNVDNVRTLKMVGGAVKDSTVVKGFAVPRDVVGTIKSVKDAKIAVYNCAVDNSSTETKGQVILTNAAELSEFSNSEEKAIEAAIKAIHDTGVNVIVSAQNFGDLAMHYIEKYEMLALKIPSKHQLRRLTAAVNATQMLDLDPPTIEEIGRADSVTAESFGGQPTVVFSQETESTPIATIILRGATSNILDDIDRALDDAVNIYRVLCKDGRLVAGAGVTESKIADALTEKADQTPGMEQYGIRQYAEALRTVPRLLKGSEKGRGGFDMTGEVLDCLAAKESAITLASEAALQVLSVDHIIMAKPAGGPRGGAAPGEED